MKTIAIFEAQTIAPSASADSAVIDLSGMYGDYSQYIRPDGFFSIQYAVTGSGKATIEYLLSNDMVTYSQPDNVDDVAVDVSRISGPLEDGNGIIGFYDVPISRAMKIRVSETAGIASITITATMAIQ